METSCNQFSSKCTFMSILWCQGPHRMYALGKTVQGIEGRQAGRQNQASSGQKMGGKRDQEEGWSQPGPTSMAASKAFTHSPTERGWWIQHSTLDSMLNAMFFLS